MMKVTFLAVLTGVLAVTVIGADRGSAEPIAAGVAVVDITPPVPYRMCGYYAQRLSTGTHDPLLAKAIVLKQDQQQVALVFCDIIGVSPDLAARARNAASEKTGIPVANIVVAATHSHTGPLYYGVLRDFYHDRAVAKDGRDPCETVDYPAQLAEGIVRAIADAQAALRPVELAAGTTQEPKLSFNRRFHMKDGSVRFNPGVNNPDIVRAAGPIDPEVGLVLVRGASDKKPVVLLTVFALHLDTTGGTEYSADFPYYLAQSLGKQFGDKFISLFGNGTCGDINHIDVTTSKRRSAGEIGAELADAVKAGLARLTPIERPSLAAAREIVGAPIQKYSPDEIAQAKETMVKAESGGVSFLDQVKATKIVDLQSRKGDTLPLEVQVVRLGDDVALVTLPGEPFVDLGLAIKKRSPFKTTIVVELANDEFGYIPTAKAFAEGSYETVNSRVVTGGGEMMVEATVRLLGQLKP
ncbi:MAG: neutral/alkaline non-lysosomal ceramidase N-terminal domain-containing protein [Planctomycetia bacterium]|nr:neutral/alkaline non-lysosomal ceramidase N-terminal domain-containing protein [Planctomycetia bacterium]